ncbi:Hsp20/alpha crystallin family protein [Carboxylicivirga linearis]|uniref:Hsp20/alpha crystallin family protein n=1 Tax=Carboxylicivirga linearis TaxID=1628157 RepID=A0ABS5K155_9BACT|nr:Hsp20/alpha crystallin family protein [Carboxylicivirga linearis]MBS2100864.1 Hsp20/alpha crystallin family protein [Carboxylicivirga linearis]
MYPKLKNPTLFPAWTDNFFSSPMWPNEESYVGLSIPAVNVKETIDEFDIEMAVPGMEKTDFKLDIDHNVLTISSEKILKKEDDNEKFTRREFSYTSFNRSFTLPTSVDEEAIKATYKEGILIINIPKKEEAKEKGPKHIEIG